MESNKNSVKEDLVGGEIMKKTYHICIKYVSLIYIFILLSGCLTARQAPSKVILLAEDKIYTLPAGQEANVLLDGKPLKMTFPQDMKIMTSETAVKKEIALNDAELKKIKADGEKKKMWGIIGSLITAIMFGLGLAFKAKLWTPKKVSITAEAK